MFRSFARLVLFFPLVLTVSQAPAVTQSSVQATKLASASLQAAVGATVLTDATLQGTVNYTAGSDEESGSFTLEVKGNQESKLALFLSGGGTTETRQAQAGEWVDAEGVQHAMAPHNCLVDASTLFPTFSVWGVLNDPQVTATHLARTLRDGVTVDHLQLTHIFPGQSPGMTAEIQALSRVDIYLDAATHLPIAIEFNIHPDKDLNINIPVEIQFSGYQKLRGITVATRVQKFIQRTLTLDFTSRVSASIRASPIACSPFKRSRG